MPETNEIVEQASTGFREISVPTTAVAVVLPLAIYGAQDLTRKGVRKVKQINENRKARKAAQSEPTPEA